MIRADQTAMAARVTFLAFGDPSRPAAAVAIQDVSEKQAYERAYRASEQSKIGMLQAIPDLVVRVTAYGTILEYEAGRYYRPFFASEQIRTRRLNDLFPERVSAPAIEHIRCVLATGEPSIFEYWLRQEGTDSVRHFEARMLRLNAEEALAIVREITDRKLAEQGLADSEARYRSLVELSPDAIIVVTDTIRFANPGAIRLLRAAEESDMIGADPLDFVHPSFRSMTDKRLQNLKRRGGDTPFVEEHWRRKDGSEFFAEVAGRALTFRGEPAVLLVIRDVTSQNLALEALRESERKFRRLIEDSVQGLCIHRRLQPLFVNHAFAGLFGYDFPDDIQTMPSIAILFAPDERDTLVVDAEVRGRTGASADAVRRAIRRDGSSIWIETRSSIVSWEGEPAVQLTVLDVTERIDMAAIRNDFVSTVSHELRTPLTSIAGSLSLIAAGMAGELPPEAKNLVSIASRNSERLVRLVNDILDVDRIESGHIKIAFEPLSVTEILTSAIADHESYAAKFGISIGVAERIDASVWAGSDQMAQIFANLLSNAIKHSPLHGQVMIRVTRRGERVRFAITDRGPGVPPEFRRRLFQKFSRADPAQQGTGLGLAICKRLVEMQGGEIGYLAEAGGGSTFYFELPEHRAAAGRAAAN
jgi:PAS domain S-box-containing protein